MLMGGFLSNVTWGLLMLVHMAIPVIIVVMVVSIIYRILGNSVKTE
ncbi:MAG: hypothetical protein ACOY46_19425 [Bacillota bacterium]